MKLKNIKYNIVFRVYCLCEDYLIWHNEKYDNDPEYLDWLNDYVNKGKTGE